MPEHTYVVVPVTVSGPTATAKRATHCQDFSAGYVQAMLLGLHLPLFNNYLRLEGYQTSAYSTLLLLASVGGHLLPVQYRATTVGGWLLAAICLAAMALVPFPAPYCDARAVLCPRDLAQASDLWPHYNVHAPAHAAVYVVLSAVAVLGASVGSPPPKTVAGYTQLGAIVAHGQTALLLNGAAYGGSFTFSVTPNALFGFCLGPAVVAIASAPPKPRGTHGGMWAALRQPGMARRIAEFFVFFACSGIEATPQAPIAAAWARVQPLSDAVARGWGTVVTATVAGLLGHFGRRTDWRRMLLVGSVLGVALDSVTVLRTVWPGLRDPWAFAGSRLAGAMRVGLQLAVAQWTAADVDEVNADAVASLLQVTAAVAGALGLTLGRLLEAPFAVMQHDIGQDNSAARWQVTYCYAVAYAGNLVGGLWLLVRPAAASSERLNAPRTTAAVLVGAAAFSCASAILAVLPSTACSGLGGGPSSALTTQCAK
ncbi:transmembrane protein [Achlya hypogyna]|uniref:Transmembrane protein n=1 Tax=Achlya hypogyna TaxID=1202772 RepID=A0A1V9YSU4_ACHHY|nr:transmembrane protein [Achlya hypogyna]